MHRTKQDWLKIHMNAIKNAKSTEKLQSIWNIAYVNNNWDIYLINALMHAYGKQNELNRVIFFYHFAKITLHNEITPSTFSTVISAVTRNVSSNKNNPRGLLDIIRTVYNDVLQTQKHDHEIFSAIIHFAKSLLEQRTLCDELKTATRILMAKARFDLSQLTQASTVAQSAPAATGSIQQPTAPKIRFFYNPYHPTQPKVYFKEKSETEKNRSTMKNS